MPIKHLIYGEREPYSGFALLGIFELA